MANGECEQGTSTPIYLVLFLEPTQFKMYVYGSNCANYFLVCQCQLLCTHTRFQTYHYIWMDLDDSHWVLVFLEPTFWSTIYFIKVHKLCLCVLLVIKRGLKLRAIYDGASMVYCALDGTLISPEVKVCVKKKTLNVPPDISWLIIVKFNYIDMQW